ncbi:MAG: peptidase M15A [Alphaproteobacteria bacterium]|nr:MAG: peptidase M15A [Alphaproteobacteria bacterium]
MRAGNERLSANFSLTELTKSDLAVRHGIDNSPDISVIANLRQVAEHILEPIRDHFSIPFSPNSGYRCLELNRLLKSPDTSQHVTGQAVDIEVPCVSNIDLASWIVDHLPFDQLILEFHTPGEPDSGWVHCSFVAEGQRGDVLTFTRAGYMKGLIA